MRITRPAALTATLTLTLTFALAACSDAAEEATGPASQPAVEATADATMADPQQGEATHNAADMAFAQGMLPHHQQAVEMAELTAGRTDTPEVLALSEEIAAAQEPEIQTMTTFIETWTTEMENGAEMEGMDADAMESMEGMDHSGMEGMEGMSGMMSPEQMSDLEAAEGAEFDQMFLQMMIAHHEGAVEMANTQLDEGENPDARALAEDIIEAQESEITRMQDLLAAS